MPYPAWGVGGGEGGLEPLKSEAKDTMGIGATEEPDFQQGRERVSVGGGHIPITLTPPVP